MIKIFTHEYLVLVISVETGCNKIAKKIYIVSITV